MYPDEQYRAFLLGIADADTDAEVEEAFLEGSLDQGYLQQVEEELIDDHLFGRLLREEDHAFRSQFLAKPERVEKLEFARALQRYASRHPLEVKRPGNFVKLRKWMAEPWVFPLVGALGCALLALIWLGGRNSSLNYQLAQTANTNNERQRVIESMREEQRKSATQPVVPTQSTQEQATLQPLFPLSGGVTRGLAAIPVLYLDPHANTVNIVLELPFNPQGTLREELQDSTGQTIWKQEFSVASGLSDHGTTSIVLPARLLATGEYQLRADEGLHGEEYSDEATYLFRVLRD